MTSTTVDITPDMHKVLANMNATTRENVRILPNVYACKCGESTFNDAEMFIANTWQKMPRINECEKCKAKQATPKVRRAETLDKWAYCKASEIVTTKRGLYIHGGFGTGKTHTAKRLYTATQRVNAQAIFTTPQDIQCAFNDCISSDYREAQVLAEFASADVLFIDDIGQEQVSERGLSQLWQVINRRYEMNRPCVYTSNYTLGALTARYASVNSVQAESICSRIAGSCTQQEMTGKDRRLTA